MDGRLRQKISLAAVTLNRSFMETQKLYTVRNWFELGFNSLQDSGKCNHESESAFFFMELIPFRQTNLEV